MPVVAGGSSIDGGTLPGGVLGDVGGEPEGPGVGHEIFGVVSFVARDGAPPTGRGSLASMANAVERSA